MSRTAVISRIGIPLLLVAIAVGVWSRSARVPDAVEGTGYVGRAVCANCHGTEAERWTGSHHDLAMQHADTSTVLGDFDSTTFTHLGVRTEFSVLDGTYRVRTEGPSGEPADFTIAYTFGAYPLQQYLVAFPGGRFQALSIAWDSRPAASGGQRWFHLYGDTPITSRDPLHWTRPSQNWNRVCAECHSTNVRKGFDPASRRYETTWSEIDVSCEACHGPGAAHVDIAEAAARDAEPALGGWGVVANRRRPDRAWTFAQGATIARLNTSPSREEIETCAQCHSRRVTLREGREAGQRLLDTHRISLLREGLYHPDGQIRAEVYVYGSFVQSKMYRAGVTCADCHDPHTLTPRAEGNALCAQCHLPSEYDVPSHHFHEPQSTGARCVECHMPTRTYMRVDPRRDHGMRIPRPDLSESIGVPNACTACHADRPAPWARDAVVRWYGPRAPTRQVGAVFAAAWRGAPAAGRDLAALAGDTTQAPIVRASAVVGLASYPRPIAAAPIRAAASDPEPLVRLAALEAMETMGPGAWGSTLALVRDTVRAVRIAAVRLWLGTGPVGTPPPEYETAIGDARAEFERSVRVNADHPDTWVDLGNRYAAGGQPDSAVGAYHTALALDSTHLSAYLNLADLLRVQGRDEAGGDVLAQALRQLPDAPELHHARGLHLVRQGQPDEALDWLARAAEAQPGTSRFGYVYGVALASAGDISRALEELAQALQRHPYDRDLLTALTTYHRDLGSVESAIGYAERLVAVTQDAGARRLLRELRARRNRPRP